MAWTTWRSRRRLPRLPTSWTCPRSATWAPAARPRCPEAPRRWTSSSLPRPPRPRQRRRRRPRRRRRILCRRSFRRRRCLSSASAPAAPRRLPKSCLSSTRCPMQPRAASTAALPSPLCRIRRSGTRCKTATSSTTSTAMAPAILLFRMRCRLPTGETWACKVTINSFRLTYPRSRRTWQSSLGGAMPFAYRGDVGLQGHRG
mmetsp:Transcript_130869/g.418807  ORF Transcript_130869/g.418807 Transcript_130869/m.418807 type:complete len:202 (-) Transcript_130869:87-692(-)